MNEHKKSSLCRRRHSIIVTGTMFKLRLDQIFTEKLPQLIIHVSQDEAGVNNSWWDKSERLFVSATQKFVKLGFSFFFFLPV